MGYASAMAWVLFVISVVLAVAIMRWSKYWVHYEVT
jgi:ABC-type sugar transport system permease subunit